MTATRGYAALARREALGKYGTSEEACMYLPDPKDEAWKALALRAARQQVGVSFFTASSRFADVATLGAATAAAAPLPRR